MSISNRTRTTKDLRMLFAFTCALKRKAKFNTNTHAMVPVSKKATTSWPLAYSSKCTEPIKNGLSYSKRWRKRSWMLGHSVVPEISLDYRNMIRII